jgi:hypothetical protein
MTRHGIVSYLELEVVFLCLGSWLAMIGGTYSRRMSFRSRSGG